MMIQKKLYDCLYKLKGKRVLHTNWWKISDKEFLNLALTRCILELDGLLSPIPKVDITSVFGDRKNIENSKAPVKIFFTGEDCSIRFKQYSDYMLDIVDLALGFDYDEDRALNPKYMHYPMSWLQFFPLTIDKDSLRGAVNWINSRPNSRENFCALVASHDEQGTRKMLYDLIRPLGEVKCGGGAFS